MRYVQLPIVLGTHLFGMHTECMKYSAAQETKNSRREENYEDSYIHPRYGSIVNEIDLSEGTKQNHKQQRATKMAVYVHCRKLGV